MPRRKEEMELLGFLPPRPGEDPRTSDPIDIVDNGAFRDIENLEQDFRDPLDVEQDPFLPQVTDNDGAPGYRPYADASNRFTEEDLDLSSDGDLAAEDQPRSDDETDDDLASIVSQREVAAIGSDGRPVSDFKMLQRADAVKNQQIAERAAYVRVNPESAYTGLLGGQVEIPAGAGADQQMVINWVGEEVEATAVTISLYPTMNFTPYPSVLAALPKGIATIRWGTRNGTQEAVVDIGSGCQFTVTASSVYVSVGHAVSSLGILNNVPIRLNASLGFHTCVKNTPLTYSSYIINTSPVVCARPPYASHVYFDRENTAAAWTLDFMNSFSAISYSRIIAANTYLTEPVKLSDDICGVTVTNGGAAASARLIWGLYL